jgi:hypothetical protein
MDPSRLPPFFGSELFEQPVVKLFSESPPEEQAVPKRLDNK